MQTFHVFVRAFHICGWKFSVVYNVCEHFICESVCVSMCLCEDRLNHFLNGPSYVGYMCSLRLVM